MRSTLRLLEEASASVSAAAAARTRAPRGRLSSGDVAAMREGASEAKYLVIDVPYTAIPTDVHRAMKEVGAVPSNFPLSSIVRQPVGTPRKAALTTRYHITTSSNHTAQQMYNVLTSRPLFAASSTRASAQPGRPAFGNGNGTKDDARVFFTTQPAAAWASKMYQSVLNSSPADYRAAERAAAPLKGLPDAKWALQPNMSGRRVLVRGLPRERPVNLVRDFIRDMGVEMEDDGLKLVVPMPLNSRANYVVTCKTVASAHFLARRLNMTPYLRSALGYNYMMRAHVVW